MKGFVLMGALAAGCSVFAGCGGDSAPPTTSAAVVATTSASATPSATRGAENSSTSTPVPSAIPAASATEAATATPTSAATSTPVPTATPSGALVQPTQPGPAPTVAATATPTIVPPIPTATPTSAPAPAPTTVIVRDNLFSPRTATVAAGGTVTWVWQGDAVHDLQSTDFAGDPAGAHKAGSYSVTFTRPGTYNYVCVLHQSVGMRGIITVQ